MVVVLLCLLEGGLFAKELVTSNLVFRNAFVLNLQTYRRGVVVSCPVVQSLSLLYNFIQLSLNSSSEQVLNPTCGVSEIRDGEDL